MKRLLCVILMLVILAGCVGETTPATEPTISTETTVPVETAPPTETEETTETTQPPETTAPPETKPLPDFLQGVRPYAYRKGAWLLDMPETMSRAAFSFSRLGGRLLLWQKFGSEWGNEGFYLSLMDLDTGKIVKTVTLEVRGYTNPIVVDDKFTVIDPQTKQIIVLNSELEEEYRWERPDGWGPTVMGSEDRVYSNMGDHILEYNMATGEERKLLEGSESLQFQISGSNGIMISCQPTRATRHVYYYLDLETGELLEQPFGGSWGGAEYENGVWLMNHYGATKNFRLGNSESALDFRVPWHHGAQLLNNGCVVVEWAESVTMPKAEAVVIYGPDGSFRTAFDATMGTNGWKLGFEPFWVEEWSGYIVCMMDAYYGDPSLFFWTEGMGKVRDMESTPVERP